MAFIFVEKFSSGMGMKMSLGRERSAIFFCEKLILAIIMVSVRCCPAEPSFAFPSKRILVRPSVSPRRGSLSVIKIGETNERAPPSVSVTIVCLAPIFMILVTEPIFHEKYPNNIRPIIMIIMSVPISIRRNSECRCFGCVGIYGDTNEFFVGDMCLCVVRSTSRCCTSFLRIYGVLFCFRRDVIDSMDFLGDNKGRDTGINLGESTV